MRMNRASFSFHERATPATSAPAERNASTTDGPSPPLAPVTRTRIKVVSCRLSVVSRRSDRLFRPTMFRISPRQFAANLWVKALPKARKIGGHLHRAMIRGQQMDDNWGAADQRSLTHSEEILQARCDPRRFSVSVVDFDAPSAGEADLRGRDFV